MNDLEKRLAYWQHVLSLKDWEITIEETEPPFMLENAAATITVNTERMMAWIYIRTGSEEEDIDHSIVHELLHAWTDSWNIVPGLTQTAKEQAINMIAKGIVTLHGRINRKPSAQYSVGAALDGTPGRRSSKLPAGDRRARRSGPAEPRHRPDIGLRSPRRS